MLRRLPRELFQRLRTGRVRPPGFMSCGSCGNCGIHSKGLQAAVDRHEATVTRLHPAALATSAGQTDSPQGAAPAVRGRPLRDAGSLEPAETGPAKIASEPPFASHASSGAAAAGKTWAPAVPPPSPPVGDVYSKTFYKRNLPSPPAIAFSSPEGDPKSPIDHGSAHVHDAALMCVVNAANKHAAPHVRRETAVWGSTGCGDHGGLL